MLDQIGYYKCKHAARYALKHDLRQKVPALAQTSFPLLPIPGFPDTTDATQSFQATGD